MKQNKLVQIVTIALSVVIGIQGAHAQEEAATYEAFVKASEGKTVIVTGSNRGQGLGWVESYLATGDSVVATCRKPKEAEGLIALKKEHGSKLLIEQLDVIDEASVAGLGERLAKGGVTFDLAVSNAGVTVLEDFGKWTKKGFDINIGVNTIGAALFAQMVAPQLKEGAKLIQLSSGAGSIQYQNKSNDLDAYAISKAGLNMLTRKLGFRLADRKVIVVSMSPGGVKTDMNPTAETSVEKAVSQMRKTVEALTSEDNGTFINFAGKKMAW